MHEFSHWILRRIFKYSSPIISMIENPSVQKMSDKPSDHHPVFIIGAPRTGSTILYQLLTFFLNISYFDNLTNLCRNNPYFGMQISNLVYKDKGHNSFKSHYGRTEKLHDPSEFGQFWRKWIGNDIDYVDSNDVSKDGINKMHNYLYAIINNWSKPLLIKNLYFSQRLKLIKEIAPDSKFIIIEREPLYTVQSLYVGYTKNAKSLNDWWSIRPVNFKEIEVLPPIERITKQIYYLEKQMYEDLKMYPKSGILRIQYEFLDNNIKNIVQISKEFLGANLRTEIAKQDIAIKAKNNKNTSDEVFKKIKEEVNKLDWETIRN